MSVNESGLRTTCSSPNRAAATSPQPSTSRSGLDERPLRMKETPMETRAIGSRYRASPKNHPTNVSSALPSGPPRSKYMARASTAPVPIRTTPVRSCSLPETTLRDSVGVLSRRRVLGGVRSRVVPLRLDDDFEDDEDFGDDFDEAVDLGALRLDPPDRFELWARGFFEGPHVFIVESTVPTRSAPSVASPSL